MSNKEKYNHAFMETLEVSENELAGLTYTGIPAWDSVGHMALMAAVMDTYDIIYFIFYEKGMEIISKKYDVEF